MRLSLSIGGVGADIVGCPLPVVIMANLKLVPANENRSQGPWCDDDFDVVLINTGERVGRIYAKLGTGGDQQWFWGWGLGFPQTLNARHPYYGTVDSKDAAKQALAERWRNNALSEVQD